MDWKHQPVEGSKSHQTLIELVWIVFWRLEWATLQPCYMLVAQWRCGHTKWDFWCWLLQLLQSTMNHPGFAPD
jgi:hypothetical protein